MMNTTDTPDDVQPRAKALGRGARRRRLDPAAAAAALGGDSKAEGSPPAQDTPADPTPAAGAHPDDSRPPASASASSTTDPPVDEPSGGQPTTEGQAAGNEPTAEEPDADTRSAAVEGPHERQSNVAHVGATDGGHEGYDGESDGADAPSMPEVDLEAAFAEGSSEPPTATPWWFASPPGGEARADDDEERAGEEDRAEPTANAEDSDEETYPVSTYLTSATKHAARKFRKDQGTTMASVALDAIDNAIREQVLAGLLERRHIEPRPEGSMFPPRKVRQRRPPKRNPYQMSKAASLQQVYLTQAELRIVDDIEKEFGAVSRSEVLAVALEFQFFRPNDDEIAQLRRIGLERRGVKPVPLDDIH